MIKNTRAWINRENKPGTPLWRSLLEHRLPTRYRQLPNKVYDAFFRIILRARKSKGKIYPVYFSCGNHFKYLFISLKSLEEIGSKCIGNVYLYIDKDDFISGKQKVKLKKLSLDVVIRKTKYKMSWGGLKLIKNELEAFEEVHSEIRSEDYIAKVDSDIVFISDFIFKYVLASGKDLVGEGAFTNYKYSQGGLYFLKSRFVPNITKYTDKNFKVEDPKVGEDKFIFNLVQRNTDSIWLTKFMMFREEFDKIKEITGEWKKKFSVIHFADCKNKMLENYG